jgi:hypothetical protein
MTKHSIKREVAFRIGFSLLGLRAVRSAIQLMITATITARRKEARVMAYRDGMD